MSSWCVAWLSTGTNLPYKYMGTNAKIRRCVHEESKVKSPCFLTEHHAMKAYWRVEVKPHAFLISALFGGV